MKSRTLVSALLLMLSGAALAQVATSPEIKSGESGDNVGGNQADPAVNTADAATGNTSEPKPD